MIHVHDERKDMSMWESGYWYMWKRRGGIGGVKERVERTMSRVWKKDEKKGRGRET
jgi:hypothetical protein